MGVVRQLPSALSRNVPDHKVAEAHYKAWTDETKVKDEEQRHPRFRSQVVAPSDLVCVAHDGVPAECSRENHGQRHHPNETDLKDERPGGGYDRVPSGKYDEEEAVGGDETDVEGTRHDGHRAEVRLEATEVVREAPSPVDVAVSVEGHDEDVEDEVCD